MLREESSVWHRPTWASRRRFNEGLLGGHLLKSELHSGLMMMPQAGNRDDDSRFTGVCSACLGSQAGCVCPHDSRVP